MPDQMHKQAHLKASSSHSHPLQKILAKGLK